MEKSIGTAVKAATAFGASESLAAPEAVASGATLGRQVSPTKRELTNRVLTQSFSLDDIV